MTLKLLCQHSLRSYNSFAVDVRAQCFVQLSKDTQCLEVLKHAQQQNLPIWVLGGGTNLLLTQDVPALVVHMATRGWRVLEETESVLLVEAAAGESWHEFVLWTLLLGGQGLENLSLIPGTVGAAPVQNIGAYGVELKDTFLGLTALDFYTGQWCDFSWADCHFAYRESVFKQQPNRWLITRVRFVLKRQGSLQLGYAALRERLEYLKIQQPTALEVSQVICSIRQEKLPDPKVLANAGSFFKNPIVSKTKAAKLAQQYPGLITYPVSRTEVKLAAGWLIEQAGWKGFRDGDAGVHRLQALVLVNYGTASGAALLSLATRIQQDIWQRFEVLLEIEPVVF